MLFALTLVSLRYGELLVTFSPSACWQWRNASAGLRGWSRPRAVGFTDDDATDDIRWRIWKSVPVMEYDPAVKIRATNRSPPRWICSRHKWMMLCPGWATSSRWWMVSISLRSRAAPVWRCVKEMNQRHIQAIKGTQFIDQGDSSWPLGGLSVEVFSWMCIPCPICNH